MIMLFVLMCLAVTGLFSAALLPIVRLQQNKLVTWGDIARHLRARRRLPGARAVETGSPTGSQLPCGCDMAGFCAKHWHERKWL